MKKQKENEKACQPGTRGCLCGQLSELYKSGKLKLYRGAVSRTRLEDELDVPRNRLLDAVRLHPGKAPGRCIRHFDKVLENLGHGTVWTEKIPAIRKVLEGHKRAGTLPVNEQGDLNRTAILREFGLGNASVYVIHKRAPKLKQVLDEFDTTRSDPAYTQYKYEALLEPLEKLLASPNPVLTHGRKISLKSLAEQLGTTENALSTTPKLRQRIEEKQSEINQRLRRGQTRRSFQVGGTTHLNLGATPYCPTHQRVFGFSELVPHFGLEFAEKVGTVFVAIAAGQSSPKAYFLRIKDFLLWLAEGPSQGIARRLTKGETIERAEFERVALTYQQEVMYGKTPTPGTKRRTHPALAVIERFGEVGVFPRVRFPRTRTIRDGRTARPRASLAEAPLSDASGKISKLAMEEAQYRGIELDQGSDTRAFVETLARESADRDDLPPELPEAVRVLCEERLIEIRRAASEVFEDWRAQHLEGQTLLSNTQYTGEQIAQLLESERSTGKGHQGYQRSRTVSDCFPVNARDECLGNLLALIKARHGGICPQATKHEWGQFWTHQYRKVGGKHHVQAFFLPPRVVVSAIVLLYLCESGTNTEVACALTSKAVRPARAPRHIHVIGRKARAKNKAIFSELPIASNTPGCTSAAEAILFYRDVTREMRADTRETPLFVHVARGKLEGLRDWTLRTDLNQIQRRSERLSSLKIVPSMIRPTVLLAVQLKNPTNPEIVQLRAQHEHDTTTLGYVRKLPFRMILEERIQRFSETLTVLIADESGRAKLCGTEAQWRKRLEYAQKTGLGVWCSDPQGGTQPDFPKESTCQAVDRCIGCSKIIVVADPESVADMVIWRTALDAAQEQWLGTRTERWEKVWVPWQAFFQVVLDEKMARGELALVKRKGQELARARMSTPEFRAPEPW